jgi:uncharacterized protein (DUF1684 family)
MKTSTPLNPFRSARRIVPGPLPPPQNRLSLAVTAGEQKYEGSAH